MFVGKGCRKPHSARSEYLHQILTEPSDGNVQPHIRSEQHRFIGRYNAVTMIMHANPMNIAAREDLLCILAFLEHQRRISGSKTCGSRSILI